MPDPRTSSPHDLWDVRWQRLADSSPQLRTQAASPRLWWSFYDQFAPLWDELTVGTVDVGGRLAELARKRQLFRAGNRVIEVGCGTGGLALALAARGAQVTAVDQSLGMIGTLRHRVQRARQPGIVAAVANWRCLRFNRGFDLAVACCVPDVLRPEGLRQLERLSHERCMVVLGHGEGVFPLRRQIWRRAMSEPLPEAGHMLPIVVGTLEAVGRRPAQVCVSWPARLDVDVANARAFFESYFAVLGCAGDRAREAIEEVLGQHLRDGRVRCTGRIDLVVLWWTVRGSKAANDAAASA
jgi:SAM-dependent methyltransferase